MGTMASFRLAVEYPGLAVILILEDPHWKPEHEIQPAEAGQNPAEGIIEWARSLSEKSYDDLLSECRRENPGWPETTIKYMCASKKLLDQNIIETLSAGISVNFTGWLKSVSKISIPTLLITADPDQGAIVTPEAARNALSLNPHISMVNIPDTGHLIRYNKFNEYIRELRSFLNEKT